MATITLTLPNPINTSLQAKTSSVATNSSSHVDTGSWDLVYFVNLDADGKQTGDIVKLGECIAVVAGDNTYTIDVQTTGDELLPVSGDYIFFGKNTEIETSGVAGYYAEVTMKNNSTEKAELFAVSSEVTVSSK
tara:strand:+ start:1013 stop:1414 length:402 start_codon:yes stop_codon:yes gene_type:complete